MADKRVCMTIPQQECRETQVISGSHLYVPRYLPLRSSHLDIFIFSFQVPSCKPVSREECRMVPRERCAVVTSGGGAGPRCRPQSRLVCEDTPRQKCGTKVGLYCNYDYDNIVHTVLQVRTQCRQEPTQKCSDVKQEKCGMQCDTVYWCKMCEGKIEKM